VRRLREVREQLLEDGQTLLAMDRVPVDVQQQNEQQGLGFPEVWSQGITLANTGTTIPGCGFPAVQSNFGFQSIPIQSNTPPNPIQYYAPFGDNYLPSPVSRPRTTSKAATLPPGSATLPSR
jgi:hypothetical protein